MKRKNRANSFLIVWFLAASVGLGMFQWYAISTTAQQFGIVWYMAWLVAAVFAITPDSFAWVATLQNFGTVKKYFAIGAGVALSLGIGWLFATTMSDQWEAQRIYLAVQFALILVQVSTAEKAITAMLNMNSSLVRAMEEHNEERSMIDTITGNADANNDLIQSTITAKVDEAIKIIVDAIPQPAPAPDLSAIEAQIEELAETVKGLQAVPVTAPKPPKKTMSPDERVEWLKDNDEAYINQLAGLTSLTASTIRRDLYKARNGAGK